MVAGEEEAAAAAVEDGQGEHAVEAADAILTVLLVGVQQHLGVGAGVEAVAQLFELGAQLAEVVDLAVVDDPEGLVLVVDGLTPGLEVDDGEAPVPHGHIAFAEPALVVRTPVNESLQHPV